jgi:hypothetical protein
MTLRISRGFRYEFRHAFLSVPTLTIVCAYLVVASIAGLQVASSPPGVARSYSGTLYESGGTFHFDFYAFDAYGSPLDGIRYSVTIRAASGGPILGNLSGTTSASGAVDLAIPLPNGSYNASIEAGPQYLPPEEQPYWRNGLSNGNISFGNLGSDTVLQLLSSFVEGVDLPIGIVGEPALRIHFPTWNVSCASGCTAYYALVSPGFANSQTPLPESGMVRLGELDASIQTFSLHLSMDSPAAGGNVQVEVFSSTGALLATNASVSASSLYLGQMDELASNQAFGTLTLSLLFVTPLLALVAAFSIYGRHRSTGVLDSVLVQPITRMELALSRLLATAGGLVLGLGAGCALTNELIQRVVGYQVYPAEILSSFLGFTVASLFFVGLVFLSAHLFRSEVSTIALSLGVYLGVILLVISNDTYGWYSLGDPMVLSGPLTNVFTGGPIFPGPGSLSFEPQLAALTGACLSWSLATALVLLVRIRTRD